MRKIIVAIAVLPYALTACTRPSSPPEDSSVPKEKWMDAMTTAMPTMLCNPQGFFRSCFGQTEDGCLDQASRATKACLIKLGPEIPAALKQPEDGEKWGKSLGACTGETMEIALSGEKKKLTTPECSNPAKWNE